MILIVTFWLQELYIDIVSVNLETKPIEKVEQIVNCCHGKKPHNAVSKVSELE
jgi:hypothetical protein